MTYSLIEGLTALGAYGIIVIVNNNLYEYVERINLREEEDIGAPFYVLVPVLGIAYLAGFLGYIILNSDVIIAENTEIFVFLSLFFIVAITHFKLFGEITLRYIKEEKICKQFTPFVCAFWAFAFGYFMQSPDAIRAIGMLSIFSIPVISAIIPKSIKKLEYIKKYAKKAFYRKADR